MQLKTYCCWVDMGDIDFIEQFNQHQKIVAYELKHKGTLPTIDVMKKFADSNILKTRAQMYKIYPLRPKACPYGGMRCCGSCTRSCVYRCAMDAYNKCSQVLLHGYGSSGTIELDKLQLDKTSVATVYNLLVNPDTTYDRLVAMANAIITKKTNPRVAEILSRFDDKTISRENHPYSFDYSPEERKWVNPKTGVLRRVVDSQGYIQFYDYPKSGLCAYCMPKNTVDRSRMTKHERNNLGNSFLK